MAGICGPHLLKTQYPNRIQFHHSANVLKSMSTTLGVIEYGTDVTVGIEDVEHLNSYSLSLPLVGEQHLSKDGCQVTSDRDSAIIVSPHENQELTINGDCRKVQVVITRAAMRKSLEDMLQRPLETPLRFEPVMDAVNGASASWWRMARYFIGELERSRELYDQTFFTRDIESSLIKGLILAQPNNYSAELHQADGRKPPHYLIKARDFIHAHARDELCIEDIEAAAGVGRSTLFDAFRQHAGLAPMAYLKNFRLEQVRRQLLEDRSGHNVSAIAIDWGFTHLGRFSADYRKRFGEAPSQTVARRQR